MSGGSFPNNMNNPGTHPWTRPELSAAERAADCRGPPGTCSVGGSELDRDACHRSRRTGGLPQVEGAVEGGVGLCRRERVGGYEPVQHVALPGLRQVRVAVGVVCRWCLYQPRQDAGLRP